jgi:hypothetical protein
MDIEAWGLLVGLIVTAVGGIWAAIRAASAAYAEAVEKTATRIENERLAKQAEATVAAKNDEINDLKARLVAKAEDIRDLKAENSRLWHMLNERGHP